MAENPKFESRQGARFLEEEYCCVKEEPNPTIFEFTATTPAL
jgi:hypothetical protein